MDPKGKVALITGGTGGIGLSCVKEILRFGAKGVTIVDLNEESGNVAVKELTEEFGSDKAIFVKADVTNRIEFQGAFEKTINTWKTIDILINNAGIFNDKNYELEIAVNSTSVVHGTLLGMQYMSKANSGKGGIIVNTSSILGLQEYYAFPVYAGTKHFVTGFSRSMGTPYHYERTGVRVGAVCPSYTNTPLLEYTKHSDLGFLSKELRQEHTKLCDSVKCQSPEAVAAAVVTLIKEGKNGSIWVAEDGEHYEVTFPDRKTLRK